MHTKIAASALLAMGLAAAPSAAQAGASSWPSGKSMIRTQGVTAGRISFSPGNVHQISMTTTDSSISAWMRSYYCPKGASYSERWVSKRCTHRVTWVVYDARGLRKADSPHPYDGHWVSSTGRSAEQAVRFWTLAAGSSTWEGPRINFMLTARRTSTGEVVPISQCIDDGSPLCKRFTSQTITIQTRR